VRGRSADLTIWEKASGVLADIEVGNTKTEIIIIIIISYN
jgi:hypothetical protein